MDCSLPGSSVHGISQERTLAWVAISFSTRFTCAFFFHILFHSGLSQDIEYSSLCRRVGRAEGVERTLHACLFPAHGHEHVRSIAHSRLTVETPWTVAIQAPLTIEFFWQEYWSRLPVPPLGCLPDPGIEPTSPTSLLLCRQIPYSWATGTITLGVRISIYEVSGETQKFHCRHKMHHSFLSTLSWTTHCREASY